MERLLPGPKGPLPTFAANKTVDLGDLNDAARSSGQLTTGVTGTASDRVVSIQGIAGMIKVLTTPDSVALPANQSVDVSKINGVTPLMGNGVTGTGSPRVTIASDNTPFAVHPWSAPDAAWSYAAASGGIANTTTAVTIAPAGAGGIRNYLKSLQISTNLGTFTATEIAIRDGAGGTVLWRGNIPASTAAVPMPMISIDFTPPLRGTAATLLEVVTLTATGASTAVYVNAQGFTA